MHVFLAVKGDEKDCDVDHIPKKTFGIPFWCWGKYSPKCSFLFIMGLGLVMAHIVSQYLIGSSHDAVRRIRLFGLRGFQQRQTVR
jgi:hypothetical protein